MIWELTSIFLMVCIVIFHKG
uniref:Uncharacterized protein n=1 Tax=Rhizophora mucronata TaxID=61149 RepID=A0A2P2NTS0_RHIMU